jgi:hypothetical protein
MGLQEAYNSEAPHWTAQSRKVHLKKATHVTSTNTRPDAAIFRLCLMNRQKSSALILSLLNKKTKLLAALVHVHYGAIQDDRD